MDVRVEFLYAIIYKLKERGMELSNEFNQYYCQPESQLYENVNNLARKLVEKQMEVDSAKGECKDIKLQVKDLKEQKSDNEKELMQIKSEKLSLEKTIIRMKEEYNDLHKKMNEVDDHGSREVLQSLKNTNIVQQCADMSLRVLN